MLVYDVFTPGLRKECTIVAIDHAERQPSSVDPAALFVGRG